MADSRRNAHDVSASPAGSARGFAVFRQARLRNGPEPQGRTAHGVPVSLRNRWLHVLSVGSCACCLAACGTLSSDREGLYGEGPPKTTGVENRPAPGSLGSVLPGTFSPAPAPNGGSSQPEQPGEGSSRDAGVAPDTNTGAPRTDAGDATAEVPACTGFALSLDGTNFAVVPRLVADDFTLEAWIQTTSSRSGNGAFYSRSVFDADVVGGSNVDDFTAGVLADRFAFAVGNPDTTVEGTTLVTTGEWVHVAVTRQASTGQLQLFVNGLLDGSTIAPNQNPLAAPMSISFGGVALVRNYIGLMDEVRIWNVVRSAEQLASSLRVRLSGSEPGLVGYYPFEDRGPTQTADLSTSAAHAEVVGANYATSSALCPAL
jgi:Concanavalin A-like lectin/glucanases superfamily